ncbi:hypothetical protein Ancab_034319 [Ancistrocladus abbreviatus]
MAPVYGGKGRIFVVAENRVLRINSLTTKPSKPVVEMFFGPEIGHEGSAEIIGLSASMLTSSLYINIKHQGLFSYTSHGQLTWTAEPVLHQFGYRQGCKKNVTECYFTSVPVIDQCEASIYISNNEGELYSLSIRSPYFKWIQDFSSFGKIFTTTPGNNGLLYITMPAKSMVFALDVSTGDILWQTHIGPLSSMDYAPVVDSNGWISIGSLDGFLYSISPTGTLKKFSKISASNLVIQVNPMLDCSGFAVYIAQTEMEGRSGRMVGDYNFISAMKPRNVIFTLLVPATGSVSWSESYPGHFSSNLSGTDLRNFILDEGILLVFIAASKMGNQLRCRSTRQRLAASCSQARKKSHTVYTGNERTILLFLLLESATLLILAIVVRFCCIFWGKRKLQNQGLGEFLEKRHSLQLKKKMFDRKMMELEQKASEEPMSDILDKLSDLVQEREGIERKLSTTYSLGRDSKNLQSRSILPLYDGKTLKSYSFRGSKRESVTIFHTFSDTSSEESSQETATSEYSCEDSIKLSAKPKGKGKAPIEVESSSDKDDNMDFHGRTTSMRTLGTRGTSSLHTEHEGNEQRKLKTDDEGDMIKRMQNGSSSIRRRTLSSTN